MKTLRDWAHVAWIALALTVITQGTYYVVKDPTPYTDVVVEEIVKVEDGYLITASFTKNTCTFKRLEVFGKTTRTHELLNWHNEEKDANQSKDYDRSAGFHVLVFVAEADHAKYDTLEIRTRHNCDGKIVDKTFATIDLGDVE